MSKKICKRLKKGKEIKQYVHPKYMCKSCSAVSNKEEEICKPGKNKRA